MSRAELTGTHVCCFPALAWKKLLSGTETDLAVCNKNVDRHESNLRIEPEFRKSGSLYLSIREDWELNLERES